MKKFDLHLHSYYSDGSDSPAELVRAAAELGVWCIALSDHDTAEGLGEAQREGLRLGVKIIRGVELSVGNPVEMHLLGYGMDVSSPAYLSFLQDRLAERQERNERMLSNLEQLGCPIPSDYTPEHVPGVYGRMHMARGLVAGGYSQSIGEAFAQYLSEGGSAYVPRRRMDAPDAMELIAKCGGRAVWAHPGLVKLRRSAFVYQIDALREQGLAGLESFYPAHDEAQVAYFRWLAGEKNLESTYGSDYHGNKDASRAGKTRSGHALAICEGFDKYDIPGATYAFIHTILNLQEKQDECSQLQR